MGWFVLAPYALAAAALLFLPGLAVGAALRLRGWALASIAPVLSITVISVAAIVADWVGLSWGLVPVAGLTLVASALVWVIVLVVGRVFPQPTSAAESSTSRHLVEQDSAAHLSSSAPAPTSHSRLSRALLPVIPFVLAAGIATWQVPRMLSRPDAFSQTWDNIFHLTGIRWIMDTSNGSSLSFNTFITGEGAASFYPAAWHDLVSLVAMGGGSNAVTYSTNAVTWAVMALVWPLGCLFLLKRLLPDATLPVRIGSGILASSFAAFPSLLVGFGVLYPNFLGFALLPVVLGLALDVLGLARSRSTLPLYCHLLALAACLPGLFLAHPNAVLSAVALVSPLVLVWAWRGMRASWADHRKRAWVYLGAAAGIMVVFLLIWAFGRTDPTWAPPNTTETSLAEVLLASPLVIRPFWILGVLILAGIWAMVAKKTCTWLLGPFAVAVLLWWSASALHSGLIRNLLTAGFYNDPYRLAALLPVVLLPISALGLDWLWTSAAAWMHARPRWDRAFVTPLAATVVCLILLVGIQASPAMTQHLKWVEDSFAITESSVLVDSDELAVIEQVPDIVSPGERVATNPWNGSSMLYALTGVDTTTTFIYYITGPSQEIIDESLDEVSSNPGRICPALADLNVVYVLDFGDFYFTDGWSPHVDMPGFEQLATAPGFTAVAQSGHAVLYKITACN